MTRSMLTAVAALSLLAFRALAQAPSVRIHGIVESFEGQTLVVKTAGGQPISVTVLADLTIIASANARLSDIKPGDFVDSAAVKGPDGKLHAEEVHIFPEPMRGFGEGHRPMGPDSSRSMTNGTAAISGSEARIMTNGTARTATHSDELFDTVRLE